MSQARLEKKDLPETKEILIDKLVAIEKNTDTSISLDTLIEHVAQLLHIKPDDTRLVEYREKAEDYLERTKYLSPLEKHVYRLMNEAHKFSPKTIGQGLEKMHGSSPYGKATGIAFFNASHSSGNLVCPAFRGDFIKEGSFQKYLHMGTSRIWDPSGELNSAKNERFINDCFGKETTLPLSKLLKFLELCTKYDPEEPGTNRVTGYSLTFTKKMQATAASSAWGEVYDRLSCGWVFLENDLKKQEPYLTRVIAQMFFQDSTLVFMLAENKLLPVPRPDVEMVEEKKVSLGV